MAYVSDEEILAGAIGDAGVLGGGLGGALAALGGRFGARLAAKLLPTRQHSEVKRLPIDVHEGFRRVRDTVSPLGVWCPDVPKGSTYPALRCLTNEACVVVTALANRDALWIRFAGPLSASHYQS